MSYLPHLTPEEKREVIGSLLHTGIVTVEFTKVDGTFRSMPCTLSEAIIPAAPVKESTETKKERKENLEIFRVYCTDKQEWRSFRIDSVINITV